MNEKIKQLINTAQKVVVIQADNPDADSLGSALALEHILGDLGKDVQLYCEVDMPGYLRYLSGWDRVQKDLPAKFDLSIIVDASTMTLLEKLDQSGHMGWLKSKPCIVLDHHAIVKNPIEFATVTLCDDTVSSTGELIFSLSTQLKWPMTAEAGQFIMTAILGDTQGLTNDLASAGTYRVMADLTDQGVNRSVLEDMRREYGKMPREIFKYKATLIDRTEFAADGLIAHVTIPQSEINEFSPLYNPAPLVQNDMLQTQGVGLTIVFKSYDDGKVTAAIRGNAPYNVAGQLAEHMGGGGHPYAAGFKIENGTPFNEVKSECITYATELLTKQKKDETKSEPL